MSQDLIADLLTRIRNAQRAGHRSVRVRSSSMAKNILDVLKNEGFVQSYEKRKDTEGKFDEYDVALKYFSSGEPAISLARRYSRSGRRVFSQLKALPRVFNGLGISIVSTSQGVMSDREARKRKIGGEVLALIG